MSNVADIRINFSGRFDCVRFARPSSTSVWTLRSWASSTIRTPYLISCSSPSISRTTRPSVAKTADVFLDALRSKRMA